MELAALIIISMLMTLSSALPQAPDLLSPLLETLGLNGVAGNGIPPLATTIHSPECSAINGGTYVCCQASLNGGLPIVTEAAALTSYPITKNIINGLLNCKQSSANEECYPGTRLCCGSIALMPLAALYCQQAN